MGTQRSLFLLLLLLLVNPLLSHAQNTDTNQSRYEPRFGSTVAVIVVVIISTFFAMVFFSLYLRRCADVNPLVHPTNATQPDRGLRDRGLDKAVVDSFPTMVYSEVKELKLGKGTLECAICLCEFEDAENLRLLPKCNHAFHPDCIGMWLDSHSSCPVCRAELSTGAAAAPPPADVAVRVEEEAAEGERQREDTRREWTEEERERFTLRLPEGLREEMMSRRLDRSSTVAVRGESGTRLAKWGRGGRSFKREWAAKSDRWAFLGRTWSLGTASSGRGRDGSRREEGESSTAAEEKV